MNQFDQEPVIEAIMDNTHSLKGLVFVNKKWKMLYDAKILVVKENIKNRLYEVLKKELTGEVSTAFEYGVKNHGLYKLFWDQKKLKVDQVALFTTMKKKLERYACESSFDGSLKYTSTLEAHEMLECVKSLSSDALNSHNLVQMINSMWYEMWGQMNNIYKDWSIMNMIDIMTSYEYYHEFSDDMEMKHKTRVDAEFMKLDVLIMSYIEHLSGEELEKAITMSDKKEMANGVEEKTELCKCV